MSDTASDSSGSAEEKSDYSPPKGVELSRELALPGGEPLGYTATAGWTVLRDKDKPADEAE